jgi:hypothetical protein
VTELRYSGARIAASRVWSRFAQHLESASHHRELGDTPLPAVEHIEAVIDAAFWTSLRREEGYIPKISLVILPPERTIHPLRFDRSLPLKPAVLAKVAPAVAPVGVHLGVWPEGGELVVWGALRTIPPFTFVLEVAAPGLLVVKHHRGDEWGKFVNVAVLEGDSVKIVDERATSLPDCPPLVTSLLGFDSPQAWVGSLNVLVQIAVSMRMHGRGGLLVVVPAGSDAWRESIVLPVQYALVPPFAELGELVSEVLRDEGPRRDALGHVVEAIAGVTAVDGATVMTDRYELLAFGTKIVRREGCRQIEQVTVTEPIEGSVAAVAHPTELGGTRHLAAAQFVQDQRDVTAFVASQDGRFTVFAWSECEGMVHAHRVEALLL